MTRYVFITLATLVGTIFMWSRFGFLPGLLMSAMFCLALSLLTATGISAEKAAESELRARAKRFRALSRQIRRRKSAPRLSKISDQIYELAQHVRRDAKNLQLADELIHEHLPRAQELVEEYVRRVHQPGLGVRYERELAEMESTIELLESALGTQNRRLLDHDVDTFHADRRGFEEMLRLDYTLDGAAADLKNIRRRESAVTALGQNGPQ